jgi:hypothetical protein
MELGSNLYRNTSINHYALYSVKGSIETLNDPLSIEVITDKS